MLLDLSLELSSVIIIMEQNMLSKINDLYFNRCFSRSGDIILGDLQSNCEQILILSWIEVMLSLIVGCIHAYMVFSLCRHRKINGDIEFTHVPSQSSMQHENPPANLLNEKNTLLMSALIVILFDMVLAGVSYLYFTRQTHQDFTLLYDTIGHVEGRAGIQSCWVTL
eukprot:1052941_1